MDAEKRRFLSKEADMQKQALHRISVWRNTAVAVSSMGIAMLYAGLAGVDMNLFLCIPGITIMAAGLICGLIMNLGLKNGRRNVEKIIAVLEGRGNS